MGKTFAAFQKIAVLQRISIILLTEAVSDELKTLSESVTILLLSFRRFFSIHDLFLAIEKRTQTVVPFSAPQLQMICHWQHEQYRIVLQSEQMLIDRQSVWLDQRWEWLHVRLIWLNQRDEWLSQRRHFSDPQYAWLNEQHAWIEQQRTEANQQVRWLQDRQTWLMQKQRKLDQLKPPPFAEAQ